MGGEERNMDFYEVIEKRRSIRVCKQGATEEQLRKIILASDNQQDVKTDKLAGILAAGRNIFRRKSA